MENPNPESGINIPEAQRSVLIFKDDPKSWSLCLGFLFDPCLRGHGIILGPASDGKKTVITLDKILSVMREKLKIKIYIRQEAAKKSS
jgi:hypothetical protein